MLLIIFGCRRGGLTARSAQELNLVLQLSWSNLKFKCVSFIWKKKFVQILAANIRSACCRTHFDITSFLCKIQMVVAGNLYGNCWPFANRCICSLFLFFVVLFSSNVKIKFSWCKTHVDIEVQYRNWVTNVRNLCNYPWFHSIFSLSPL